MTTQAEMFPKSKIDFAQEFAEHFQADVEAAEKALLRAQDRLTEATRLRDDAEENLRRELDMAQGGTETAISRDSVPSEAQEPHGAGSGPDAAAGVDPITGEVEPVVPSVFVHYPDADDDVETEVGQYTTYGELIADYLTASGIDAEPGAYMVLDAEDGDLCPTTAQIAPEAYGRRYAVLLAPQTVESAA